MAGVGTWVLLLYAILPYDFCRNLQLKSLNICRNEKCVEQESWGRMSDTIHVQKILKQLLHFWGQLEGKGYGVYSTFSKLQMEKFKMIPTLYLPFLYAMNKRKFLAVLK